MIQFGARPVRAGPSEEETIEPLEIVYYPDPILRRPTDLIGEVTDEIRALVPLMMEAMVRARGIGLAANQVGISKRIALVSETAEPDDVRVVIDPEILSCDGALAIEEGCLSFPGLTGLITRPERVVVRYTNLDGEQVTELGDERLVKKVLGLRKRSCKDRWVKYVQETMESMGREGGYQWGLRDLGVRNEEGR